MIRDELNGNRLRFLAWKRWLAVGFAVLMTLFCGSITGLVGLSALLRDDSGMNPLPFVLASCALFGFGSFLVYYLASRTTRTIISSELDAQKWTYQTLGHREPCTHDLSEIVKIKEVARRYRSWLEIQFQDGTWVVYEAGALKQAPEFYQDLVALGGRIRTGGIVSSF